MSWLATWFIFELLGVGAAPNLTEPQAFENVSLQMIAIEHLLFVVCYKKLHHIQVFDVRYEWPK